MAHTINIWQVYAHMKLLLLNLYIAEDNHMKEFFLDAIHAT